MCIGVFGRCAPADVELQCWWWVRYTSTPPRAQMAAYGGLC